MPSHPLAEVFGFPVDNQSKRAQRHRNKKLCPYNNKVPNCTKDKANDPLGVCSIYDGEGTTITCPVRFREDWLIAEDAASFFFSEKASWTSLTEVQLKDANGQSAGNIDVVPVSYDAEGSVLDFGSLEIQGVYISGNIRRPFQAFMKNPSIGKSFIWDGPNYPRADYLSSSRKRLIPQLMFKGGIFHTWKKKSAVALTKAFFDTLPSLKEVPKKDAEIAWLIYELELASKKKSYHLVCNRIVYTRFEDSLSAISKPNPGQLTDFLEVLQEKLDDQFENENNNPPDAPTLADSL